MLVFVLWPFQGVKLFATSLTSSHETIDNPPAAVLLLFLGKKKKRENNLMFCQACFRRLLWGSGLMQVGLLKTEIQIRCISIKQLE